MDVGVIQSIVGGLPGGAVAVLAIWFALRKDAQCTELMKQLGDIATKQALSNQQVVTSLDAIREAIGKGTRS